MRRVSLEVEILSMGTGTCYVVALCFVHCFDNVKKPLQSTCTYQFWLLFNQPVLLRSLQVRPASARGLPVQDPLPVTQPTVRKLGVLV